VAGVGEGRLGLGIGGLPGRTARLLWLLCVLTVLLGGCRAPRSEPAPPSAAKRLRSSCDYCHKPLSGPVLKLDGKSYHERCFQAAAPRCGICHEPLEGLIAIVGPGPGYHSRCFSATPRCDACSLPTEGERGGSRTLRDGRIHCATCQATSINDLFLARQILSEARRLLREELGIKIPGQTPVFALADRRFLARLAQVKVPRVKGFTEASRRERALPGGGLRAGPWRIKIWAVYGLPREALLGVLVHELFHVWQLRSGIDGLAPAFREGAANYAQWRVMKKRGDPLWPSLVETDPDPVYGNGFRRFRKLAEDRGWKRLRDELSKLRDFP